MELEVSFVTIDENKKNTIEGSDDKCHILTEIAQLDHRRWMYNAVSSLPNVYLFGPVSLKETKAIIYPCNRHKCQLRCPCYICRGIQSARSDMNDLVENHKRYHHVPHLSCNYCEESFQTDQTYTFNIFYIIVTRWKLYHTSFENVMSRGKAYRDYCWKRDFGDEENITWDKYFSKRGKNV